MTETEKQPIKLNFGERVEIALSVFIRAFLRLLIFIIVGVGIGLAVYYGFPYLYQQVILPVQTNTLRLQEIKVQQAADNQVINQRLDQLQARLATLEKLHTQDKETISDLSSRLGSVESLLNSHATTLKRLDDLQTAIDLLKQQISQNQADTAKLGDELHASNSPLAAITWEVQVLKGMELISRARLSLIQNNIGLARQDIQAARTILANPKLQPPTDQQAGLTALLVRLDLVLGNLPASPITAADDMEIAWRQLAAGLANNPDSSYMTNSNGVAQPSATLTATPTLFEPPSTTPTPTTTSHVSPTPTLKSTSVRTLTPTITLAPVSSPTLTAIP